MEDRCENKKFKCPLETEMRTIIALSQRREGCVSFESSEAKD